ncbi:MAG: hypothetical protein K8I65_17505, partial [Thermoanaerobaculia bacterium]|nr:hypothetical protein [Thermoanaerobaculia bacterium]
MSRPPARTRRLFPDGLPDADAPAGRDALIARLLEDGDRADLEQAGDQGVASGRRIGVRQAVGKEAARARRR